MIIVFLSKKLISKRDSKDILTKRVRNMHIGTSKVTSKGQITIPEEIRKEKGITAGKNLVFVDLEEGNSCKKE